MCFSRPASVILICNARRGAIVKLLLVKGCAYVPYGSWLIPAVAFCNSLRYARLGDFDGKPEVQIHAADGWQPAVRNLPLPQSARVQTPAGSHVEIELDDGSVVRLAPESLLELSDYTRLSSGQRVTLLSLDRGLAYFTGQSRRQDALMLALPGAQLTIQHGTRVRMEAQDAWSEIAVIEGKVRFASPSAEMDLKEGEMARVDPSNRAKFYLYRELTAYDSDKWSEARDKEIAFAASADHVRELHYGVHDLDGAGSWIETQAFGTVWKPKAADGWMPFRDGKWAWYDDLGYTWIANEPWGWLPYHYGRWMRTAENGWFWVPGNRTVFKPGDVYWLRGLKVAGWGPLAPGEDSATGGVPQLYLAANTTWAALALDARTIDPAGFNSRPKEPLEVASFAPALPSPAFLPGRLEATRPPLRTGVTRILPLISGVTYEETVAQAPPPPAPAPVTLPPDPAPSAAPPPPPIIVAVPPPELPVEILYPVPVYTGVVVINPPENKDAGPRRRSSTPAATPPTVPASSPRVMSPEKPRVTKPAEAHPPSSPRNEPPREQQAPAPPVRVDRPREITRVPPPAPPVTPAPGPRVPAVPSGAPAAQREGKADKAGGSGGSDRSDRAVKAQ